MVSGSLAGYDFEARLAGLAWDDLVFPEPALDEVDLPEVVLAEIEAEVFPVATLARVDLTVAGLALRTARFALAEVSTLAGLVRPSLASFALTDLGAAGSALVVFAPALLETVRAAAPSGGTTLRLCHRYHDATVR